MQFLICYHGRRSTKRICDRFFNRFDPIKGNLTCMKINIEAIKLLLLCFGCTRVKGYRSH